MGIKLILDSLHINFGILVPDNFCLVVEKVVKNDFEEGRLWHVSLDVLIVVRNNDIELN